MGLVLAKMTVLNSLEFLNHVGVGQTTDLKDLQLCSRNSSWRLQSWPSA